MTCKQGQVLNAVYLYKIIKAKEKVTNYTKISLMQNR